MKESIGWLLFIIAALFLFLFLGIHITFIHLSSLFGIPYEETLKFAHVAKRSANLGYAIFYIIFLLFALYHGMYGLRTVILETPWGVKNGKVVTWIIVLLGLFFFVIGTWAAIAAISTGKSFIAGRPL